MAFKVVLALAVVALAAADDGYNYDAPVRSFSFRNPVRAAPESSEEDGGYDYQAPARTFTHRTPKPVVKYVAPVDESSEEDGYNYQQPARTFTFRTPKPVVKYVAPVDESSEEDGYNYQQPARTFTHRTPKPVVKYVAPVDESSEEDGYNYQQPARTFTHKTPVRVAVRPRKTYVAPKPKYVAPAKPVVKYVAPVVKYVAPVADSSEEDGYNYQQPARTFSHNPPTRVAARPKSVYVAPTQAPKPVNTYQAPANTYKAPESDELDYIPVNPEYNHRYEVSDDETGAEFHQEEERDGDQTRGSYSVDLPDGRVQTVTYYVNGDGGFVAEVTYTGEAQFPPAPEGGYGPWTGATAGPPIVRGEYSAPAQTYVAPDSSEEVARPRGLYNAPRA